MRGPLNLYTTIYITAALFPPKLNSVLWQKKLLYIGATASTPPTEQLACLQLCCGTDSIIMITSTGLANINAPPPRAQNKGVWSDRNRPSWSFVRTKACMVGHAAVPLSELNH